MEGKFGFFNFPFTSPNFLKKSFAIPPRTTILGILGSIIGLNGFQQYQAEYPEYYEKLNHIGVAVFPNKIPRKKLITYNSMNSFAKDIETNPNVMIKEEVLLAPSYTIALLLDDTIEADREILRRITPSQVTSEYPIYLGKNEFFAHISDVEIFGEDAFKMEMCQEVESLDSIIPIFFIDTSPGYEYLVYDSFSKDIDFSDKKLRTKLCEVGYFLEEEEENKITFEDKVLLCKTKDNKNYFFFDNET